MVYKIYKLSCKCCNKFYIGQTGANLFDRLYQHQRRAHNGSKTRLHDYMRNCGITNFKIKTLWKLDIDDKVIVDDMEQMFIKLEKPELNIAVRKISEIGNKRYLQEYREKMRRDGTHRCDVCNLNCVARIHLIEHLKTTKHLNKENELLNYYSRL